MTSRIAVSLLTAAAFAAAAPAALAAPAHNGTLAVGGEVAWNGGPLNGIAAVSDISDLTGCQPAIAECDDTLLKVDATGVLSVKIADGSAGAADLDLYVHKSDAAGAAGDAVKSSAGPTADEGTTLDVEPGYYLVRVRAAISAGGTYKGTAKLAAPEELPPPPGGNPPPPPPANLPPVTTVTKPRGKTITAIRGTASDDAKVAKVRAGLVLVKGDPAYGRTPSGAYRRTNCFGLTAKGTFAKLKKCTAPTLLTARGTTKWTLKLKRPLKKGKYVAYAIATDDKGVSEGGYGKRNSVAFTVK
jgi:hypothetical protein